jgi:hypothetical protein
MAVVAMIRNPHVGALSAITSSQLNSHQTLPFSQHVTRVAPGDKYTPFREKHLQRVLSSPYRAHLLSLKGYYIDENNIIQKDPRFKMAALATEPETPSPNHQKHTSATSITVLHAPSTVDLTSGSSATRASPTNAQPRN